MPRVLAACFVTAMLFGVAVGTRTLTAEPIKSPEAKYPGAKPPEAKSTEPKRTAAREAAQTALAEFNGLIGEWRGVGQPVRNSNKGSWTETAAWVWDLKGEQVAIRLDVKQGKQLQSGRLLWDAERQEYELEAVTSDQKQRTYRGKLVGNKLTLETSADDAGETYQIVLTQLNDKRSLLLFQSKGARQQQFNRIAEVGYTRAGTKLAEDRVDGPECIVTGGKGTMSKVYQGKTYWFCCTGCRDAFEEDPEGILAQAAERETKKKTKASSDQKPKPSP
jgi:YHS domain-containing protein